MKRTPFLLAVLTGLMSVSCLEKNINDSEAILEAKDVFVPADMETGDVECDVPVVSNVSWTAGITGNPDWITAVGMEHVNPSGASDSGIIHLKFKRNDSHNSRTATISFHAKGVSGRQISITQRGKNDRVRIDSEPMVEVVAEPADAIPVKILSNVRWEADVEAGATAAVTLETASGNGDGTVNVKFSPNYEITEDKTATIVVRAEGVDAQRITFVQKHNEPFLRLSESSSVLTVNPNKDAAKIAFRANAEWTSEVISSTMCNLDPGKLAGTSGWANITPTFDKNDGDDIRTAEILYTLKDYPDVKMTVSLLQKAGTVVELTFAKGSKDWQPNLPSTYRTELFKGEYKHIPSNYSLKFHVLQGDAFALYDATSLCFSVGAQAISWIEFPCLEGMALSNLYIHSSNTTGGQTFYVYDNIDPEGNRGNALAKSVKITHNAPSEEEISWGDTTPWTIAPEEGQTVYVYQSKQNNAKIDNITLIFTKI